LLEIIGLFPGGIIHIGGDEVPKAKWHECPSCQDRISNLSLPNEEALQTYFTNRIAAFLADHGIRMIGWNEILQDGLVNSAIGQIWSAGDDLTLAQLRQGRKLVMSPTNYVYLDYSYNAIRSTTLTIMPGIFCHRDHVQPVGSLEKIRL